MPCDSRASTQEAPATTERELGAGCGVGEVKASGCLGGKGGHPAGVTPHLTTNKWESSLIVWMLLVGVGAASIGPQSTFPGCNAILVPTLEMMIPEFSEALPSVCLRTSLQSLGCRNQEAILPYHLQTAAPICAYRLQVLLKKESTFPERGRALEAG